MENGNYRTYENGIKSVLEKINKKTDLSYEEEKIFKSINKTKFYLRIYDQTESTFLLKIFNENILNLKNRRKSGVAIAMDIGYCRRSIIRFKRKILQIFACILNNEK